MSPLVIVDEVAVGHVGKAFAVAVLAALRGHHLVSDEIRQEGGTGGGREAHVGGLHRGWQQCKNLVAGALQERLHERMSSRER